MPCFSYADSNRDDRDIVRDAGRAPRGANHPQDAPQPPAGYNTNSIINSDDLAPVSSGGDPRNHPDGNEAQQTYQSARRLVIAAQIMSLVSLIIGGVILSGTAVVVAIVGYRKAAGGVAAYQGDMIWRLLKRSATMAIVMAILALGANIMALVIIYPLVVEALQTGDLNSLLGSATSSSPSTTAPNTTWG